MGNNIKKYLILFGSLLFLATAMIIFFSYEKNSILQTSEDIKNQEQEKEEKINLTQDVLPDIQVEDQKTEEEKEMDNCKNDILKMDVDELTKKIINIVEPEFLNQTYNVKSFYLRDDFLQTLSCRYRTSNDEKDKDKIFNNASLLIEQDAKRDGKGPSYIPLAKENFKEPSISFIQALASSDPNKYCPDILPTMCLRENNVYYSVKPEWCENICITLSKYKNDSAFFKQEVVDFVNTDPTIKNEIHVYSWRIVLMVNFLGTEETEKICRTKPESIRGACENFARRIKIWNTDCEKSDLDFSFFVCSDNEIKQKILEAK